MARRINLCNNDLCRWIFILLYYDCYKIASSQHNIIVYEGSKLLVNSTNSKYRIFFL